MARMFILDGEPIDDVPQREDRFGPNWDPRTLKSMDDCTEARDQIMGQITSIERQLMEAEERRRRTGEFSDAGWYRAAKSALKFKKISLQKVAERRGELNREARRQRHVSHDLDLIGLLKETDPAAFDRLMAEARRRGISEA